jgi:hypothetical protein
MHRCGWFGGVAAYFIGPYWCVCVCVVHFSECSAQHTNTHQYGPLKHAATPPNQPQWCILTDYFNNYNFSKLK